MLLLVFCWMSLCACLIGFSQASNTRVFAPAPIRRASRKHIARLGFFLVLSWAGLASSQHAFAAGSAYYVDNRFGSNCSDGGAHTASEPFCTFYPLNAMSSFKPGDQILLARGASWNQQLTLHGKGSAEAPIELGAYGSGPNPKILRNQAISDICVLLTDGSFWKISDLEVGRASVGILLHYTQLNNQGITISNVYVHDNKGIWGGYSTDYPVRDKVRDPFASSLNINLSSGILFNIAADLAFSSSQYVLKGVNVHNVRGTNNVDSVSFDAETSTVENEDGHNAFQDVVLNGLFLASDNGHAGERYQSAGLGCSDALRLVGMTNVTVMNSVLYDEAGCHTPTGTAAVILGRVSNVGIVNNIFFGVPHSSSPDETAIDFEWSEEQVTLQGNLFAQNAGAAVEILNIHPDDHTDAIDLRGNTFLDNAHSHLPGAASIWEDNKGKLCATPSGRVHNNLYFERHGGFLGGKSIALISRSNDLPMEADSNYAAELFSATQGKNQWRYVYEASESSWSDLPQYSTATDNGAWTGNAGGFVSAFNLAPASCSGKCNSGGVAREWVAPATGTVSIRGRVLKAEAGGNGVNVSVKLVSGKTVTALWPKAGGRKLIAGEDQAGLATDLDNIHVSTGDVIRFEVNANGDSAHDTVSWTPSVGYVQGRPMMARGAM